MTSTHCAIHLLQLVVKDGLFAQRMGELIIKKCREVVAFLSHSSRATEAFRAKQAAMSGRAMSFSKQLVKDVETRWNSSYLMMKRILTLKAPLEEFLEDEHHLAGSACDVVFSANDWAMMSAMVEILAPFFRATELLSHNKICIAQVLVIIQSLELEVRDCNPRYIGTMKTTLLEVLHIRFFSENPREKAREPVEYNLRTNPLYTISTLLNPQFRQQCFKKAVQRAAVEELIKAMTQLDRLNKELEDKRAAELQLIDTAAPVPVPASPRASTSSGGNTFNDDGCKLVTLQAPPWALGLPIFLEGLNYRNGAMCWFTGKD